MRAPRSLRARIVLAALGGLLVIGVATAAVLLAALEREGRRAVDRELAERGKRVLGPGGRDEIGPPGGGPGELDGPGGPGRGGLLSGSGRFTLVAAGDEVRVFGDVPAVPPAPTADGLRTIELAGDPWRTLTSTVGRTSAGEAVRVQVAATLAPVAERVAGARRIVVLVGLAALALTGLATWLITTVALRPLDRLRAGAARITGARDLQAPLADTEGPDEVRSVAAALNAMLARLRASAEQTERALLATRRFAADAGHELRTPLTSLRANLEALERNPDLPAGERDALVADSLAVQDRMVRLLAGLQALARGEAAETLPREPVDLGDLVEGALFAARRRHPAARIALAEADEGVVVHGWEGGLRLVVDNLVDNAVLHGGPAPRVEVRVRREDAHAVLRVEDDGPGVPVAERQAVLEPFARGAATTAAGTGLGLAIVAQQAALHGGTLTLGDAALGGLAVTVTLAGGAPVPPRAAAVGAAAGG